MKNFLNFSLILTIVIAVFTGCGRTSVTLDIDNSRFLDKSIASSKVEQAIKTGAMRKGWRIKKINNGLVEASITVRGKHFVAVNINYTDKGYKISYKNSENMNYVAATKEIHPNYNKWVSILEQNINVELSNLGMGSAIAPIIQESKTITATKPKVTSGLSLQGKTIYIKPMVTFSARSNVAANIKTECTLPQAISDNIVKFATQRGINIESKNTIGKNDLELKIQIESAISAGNAGIGHNKYVTISGAIVKGDITYYTFDAARLSGGGYFGVYRSSCSVLGSIAKSLGRDVGTWLSDPYNGAMLGDTQLIRK